ncbi:MAG: dGTP triphosphohydrolase [Rubrivivax sp.]|jgi:dGTPase|uniref:dGTP triphosphohydrolase n=1 Tax=Inhella sp. TaxID=1921806 RepID=UPI0022BDCB10|nr:dNTP triphosphohydrolase [Inhella sp.]MCZ8235372.1 dNTP triphosphohydrolase [Inhella sp.]
MGSTAQSDAAARLQAIALWAQRRSADEVNRAKGAYRNPYARDRARLLHCSGFRRLQGKYVLPGLDQGDLMRTRLTQSLEVAQLSRGLLRALDALHSPDAPWRAVLPDPNLVEAIAFARFLGSTPLGHGGELALQTWMADWGGFQVDAQALRAVCALESYSESHGLDLSRRVLIGCLTHPAAWPSVVPPHSVQPPGAYYEEEAAAVAWMVEGVSSSDAERFLRPAVRADAQRAGRAGPPSWDCSIVKLAWEIAHGVHELEDGIALGRIGHDDWRKVVPDAGWASAVEVDDHAALADSLFGASEARRRRAIGTLINAFVVSVEVDEWPEFESPLLRYQASLMPQARAWLKQLGELVDRKVFHAPELAPTLSRGLSAMQGLLETCWADPERCLPGPVLQRLRVASGERARRRCVADWLAGLPDFQCVRLQQQWRL